MTIKVMLQKCISYKNDLYIRLQGIGAVLSCILYTHWVQISDERMGFTSCSNSAMLAYKTNDSLV